MYLRNFILMLNSVHNQHFTLIKVRKNPKNYSNYLGMKGKEKALRATQGFLGGWKTGFEPATSGTTIQRSNQLSYNHHNWAANILALKLYLQPFYLNFLEYHPKSYHTKD